VVRPVTKLLELRRTDQMLKRHKPEEVVANLRQVDVLTSQGQSVADAVRALAHFRENLFVALLTHQGFTLLRS
jgi:crotonobetainyl-CoA:carnitine CoA-transferase CaiB-like acyl-CoA transferase